jgi:hypothetical protein
LIIFGIVIQLDGNIDVLNWLGALMFSPPKFSPSDKWSKPKTKSFVHPKNEQIDPKSSINWHNVTVGTSAIFSSLTTSAGSCSIWAEVYSVASFINFKNIIFMR